MTVPATSERNFMPSSTALASLTVTVDGTEVGTEHTAGTTRLRRRRGERPRIGAAIVWPVAFVAPLTVAVYVVPYARALPGVNVAVLLAES